MLFNFKQSALDNWLEKILSLGVFFILTGLTIVQKISIYHTFFYILIIIPIIFNITIHPREITEKISNITKILIIFSIWSSLSILWSDTYDTILSPIKRSLYTILLFISFSIIANKNQYNILKIFIFSGFIISLTAIYSLYIFQITYQPESRLIGTGALSNPLLSSHIFGIFSVLFLTLTLTTEENVIKSIYLITAIILIITTVATGSRTFLLAITASAIWIAFIFNNKKSIITIAFLFTLLIFVYFLYPEAILSRGLSYRPELWSIAIEQILEKPFFGYGFDSTINFYISELDTNFREPHNIHLSILYFTGIIGFSLWCAMHIYALWACWKNKSDTLFIIASALVVYGIAAGMTEGGGLLPRPKEHWFITWIPLAFVSALLTSKNLKLKIKESVADNT